jgi:hypothetical protein
MNLAQNVAQWCAAVSSVMTLPSSTKIKVLSFAIKFVPS